MVEGYHGPEGGFQLVTGRGYGKEVVQGRSDRDGMNVLYVRAEVDFGRRSFRCRRPRRMSIGKRRWISGRYKKLDKVYEWRFAVDVDESKGVVGCERW